MTHESSNSTNQQLPSRSSNDDVRSFPHSDQTTPQVDGEDALEKAVKSMEDVKNGNLEPGDTVQLRSSRPPQFRAPTGQSARPTAQTRMTNASMATNSVAGSSRPVQAEFVGWVDDEYYEENPWYGRQGQKPIFSLGKPLPRTSRRSKRLQRRGKSKAPNELAEAEAGQGGVSRTASQASGTRPRRTAAGSGHTGRINDVGQPVFDYIPERVESRDESVRRVEREQSTNGPSFGIDSEPLGPREREDEDEESIDPDQYRNWWARVRAKHPEPLAEFLATAVTVFLGLCGTLSVNLSGEDTTQYGSYETACWAWGFAFMFGIYLGGGVSGAHMNPAISISLSVFRGFPWRRCATYIVAQLLAGLVAGALAYATYSDSIKRVDPFLANTSKTFFSTPQEWVSPGVAFLNQVIGSAILLLAVLSLGDDQNNPPGAGMHAFVLGLLVTTLKFTLGYNVGSALNPASDFGPRIVAYAVGYRGHNIWGSWWWLYGPWVATLIGSLVGCLIYDSFVFVGSESPVNYRFSPDFWHRKEEGKKLRGK